MRKIILLILFFASVNSVFAQIPNAGFETWVMLNPDQWATSNVFPAGVTPVTQSGDSHSGLSAMKGEVVMFMNVPYAPVAQSGTDATGFPVSERFSSLQLYYKFTPLSGDRFSVNAALEKEGVAIAQGAVAISASADTYTLLTVPFVYTSDDVPDHAIIQLSIVGPVTGTDYHPGSVFYADDLSFTPLNAISENRPAKTSCFPVPATTEINIPVRHENLDVSIFDPCGNLIRRIATNGGQLVTISITDLAPGVYFFSVDGKAKGKFIKQ